MKHSFLKLISSFYILLISLLMIVIAAYAWMVISDSPAVGNIGFGVAGLDAWEIPEDPEPEYDYMDDVYLTNISTIEVDEKGRYIIDTAEKFVFMMQDYIPNHTAWGWNGNLAMVLTKHISLENHEMLSGPQDDVLVDDETGEPIIEPYQWQAAAWVPTNIDGYHGVDKITIEVDPMLLEETETTTAYIKGMAAPLFSGGFAGGCGVIINDLTIFKSDIVSKNATGSGAFVEYMDSMDEVTLRNCHLLKSTVEGSQTGGLIGYTTGYNNTNDGPVKMYVTLEDCSVIDCTIKGSSSVGGINGHAGANPWTYTVIKNCTVKDTTLISSDSGWRVGEVVGTANTGELTIADITTSGNMLAQTGETPPTDDGLGRTLYGRFVPAGEGRLALVDNTEGWAYVAGGFIQEAATLLTTDTQDWFIDGAVKLTQEIRFTGDTICIQAYADGASIIFSSNPTGYSHPGQIRASAGFNFGELNEYVHERKEGASIHFENLTLINDKVISSDFNNADRHTYSIYAYANKTSYSNCEFQGTIVVYSNDARFDGCTFTESIDNRYCLFFDDQYSGRESRYVVKDCTFTAASTAYGCLKIAEDKSTNYNEGATLTLLNSTFNNETTKPAVYVNGYTQVITDGKNKSNSATGGIQAKMVSKTETTDEDGNTTITYITYVTYQIGDGESKACLTVDEYKAGTAEQKAEWDKTEFGNNANPSSTVDENGETTETTETDESTSNTESTETGDSTANGESSESDESTSSGDASSEDTQSTESDSSETTASSENDSQSSDDDNSSDEGDSSTQDDSSTEETTISTETDSEQQTTSSNESTETISPSEEIEASSESTSAESVPQETEAVSTDSVENEEEISSENEQTTNEPTETASTDENSETPSVA